MKSKLLNVLTAKARFGWSKEAAARLREAEQILTGGMYAYRHRPAE